MSKKSGGRRRSNPAAVVGDVEEVRRAQARSSCGRGRRCGRSKAGAGSFVLRPWSEMSKKKGGRRLIRPAAVVGDVEEVRRSQVSSCGRGRRCGRSKAGAGGVALRPWSEMWKKKASADGVALAQADSE